MTDHEPSRHESRPAGSHFQPSLPVVLVIIVLFIGGAVLMLRTPSPGSAGGTSTTTTTTASGGGTNTTTTTVAINRSKVTVQVANGTNVTSLAANYTQRLLTLNWDTLPPDNAPHVASTIIYFNPGHAAAARLIASEIKMPASSVRPRGSANPVAGAANDDVIVVLGPNASTSG